MEIKRKESIAIQNVSVGLDVDLALFRRQAIAGTSDDLDHRRIYASPELNFYIDGRFICISIVSLSLEIPIIPLAYEHYFIRVVYVFLSTIVHVAYSFIYVLKVGDYSDLLVLMLFVLQCTDHK